MNQKRLRIFAGPNGSGKTTIITKLRSIINLGVYVNADDIEKVLNQTQQLSFKDYKIIVSENELLTYFKKSKFSLVKSNIPNFFEDFTVKNNILYSNQHVDSYIAADLSEFIRLKLLMEEKSFSFETVMSHANKLDLLRNAKELGYRIYLYFVCTENPQINVSRVNIRTAQNGHFVKPDIIIDRYYRSLNNLKQAVMVSDRAFLWDNSDDVSYLFAEITTGIEVEIFDQSKVPYWFHEYLIQK